MSRSPSPDPRRSPRPTRQGRARPLGCLFVLLVVAFATARPVAGIEVVSLGDGPSLIVEYDRALQPIRKYTGLYKPVDITPIGNDRLLLVDEGSRLVILAKRDGTVLWREAIGGAPLRARPRPGGGFLISTVDRAIGTRADRTIEWEVAVRGLRTAVPLAGGNFVAASNDHQGWLTEMTPDGRTVWRSRPTSSRQATGGWLYTPANETFRSAWALDAAPDGTVFTADFDHLGLRLLSGTGELLRDWEVPDFPHVTDTRFGPDGELVAASPEAFAVWIGRPDGPARLLPTEFPPWSAALTGDGTLLVGLEWRPEASALNATAARSAPLGETPVWYRRPAPMALVGLFLSSLVCAAGLGPLVRRAGFRSPPGPGPAQASAEEPADRAVPTPDGPQAIGFRRPVVRAGLLAILGAGVLLAWHGARLLGASSVEGGLWRIALGCLTAGAALRLLGRFDGTDASFSSFRRPETAEAPARDTGTWPRRTMVALAAASLGGCLLLESRPESMAAAIGLWIAAQVLILGASLAGARSSRAGDTPPWGHLIALALLLLASTALGFWEIGNFPDWVHHDHGIYGDSALRLLHGEWQPFFTMDPQVHAISRPWMASCAAALAVFGAHDWVLRLTGAIAGVMTVLGTYLVGKALFNRNVGLIAGVLAAVNHVLLLHARQPFILEPVPLFVFCVFLFVRGMQLRSRVCFCASGVLASWTLLVYWASLTLAAAGLVIGAGLLLLQPRWVYARVVGLVWFLLGAAAAYAPMVASMLPPNTVSGRVSDLVVLLNPDGSIRWDAALWTSQTLRSFGGLVVYPDNAAWGVGTGQAVCSPVEIVLLGAGLVFLFSFHRSAAAVVLIPWVAVSVFLGSATLQYPPSYYHFLAAVVPVVVICAIPLERLLAWTGKWRRLSVRAAAFAGVLCALAAAAVWQLGGAWDLVRRPTARNGSRIYTADEKSLVARFIRDNPEYRYYLVRSPHDVSCLDPIFLFFANDSDVSDLTHAVGDALPVPSVTPAPGAAFVVLASRTSDLGVLRRHYPGSREVRLQFAGSLHPVVVFLVDAGAVDLALARPISPGTS